MTNEHITDSRWSQVKCEIRKAWCRLTETELDETNGDVAQITDLVNKKYGESKESVMSRLNAFIERFGEDESPKTESQIRNQTVAP